MESSLNEIKANHEKEMAKLQANFIDQLRNEIERRTKLEHEMQSMKMGFEDKLRHSDDILQATVYDMKKDFQRQLQERRCLLRLVMQELQEKNTEFEQYCSLVNTNHDHNLVDVKVGFEEKLKNKNDLIVEWRLEATNLKNKLSKLTTNCKEYEIREQQLEALNVNNKKLVRDLKKVEEELRGEISDRVRTIQERETKLNENDRRIQELEKYKVVLGYKIDQLNSQIEPKNREINEKLQKIEKLENELENFEKTNMELEVCVSEQKDKLRGVEAELRGVKGKIRTFQKFIIKFGRDIYQVSRNIQNMAELKNGVIALYRT